MGEKRFLLFVLLAYLPYIYSIPADGSFSIVGPPESTPRPFPVDVVPIEVQEPKILEMHVTSNVANRFANTIIRSKVQNFAQVAREIAFMVVLPERAYISGFIMEIGGKNYTAYVEEKAKAQKIYDNAKASGLGAAQVSARDSNKFTVSMNLEPNGIAVFFLYYDELLERSNSIYEVVLNMHPNQIVGDLKVEVIIEESRDLTSIKTPQIRTGNTIIPQSPDLDPEASIQLVASNKVIIVFRPSREKQIKIAKALGTDQTLGIAGQFVVQYDVQRDPNGGEVLIKDGYFVHFFAPSNQERLRKHVVFVLDTSGSMYGDRIRQLKEALKRIFTDLAENDYYSIIEFNTNVKEHKFDSVYDIYKPYVADAANKIKAIAAIMNLVANGMTNIHDALSAGLNLIKANSLRWREERVQPIIFFLTDGEATSGVTTDPRQIVSRISEQNTENVPIYSLSFGDGADKAFLETLSLNNFAFARHIYEDSDASLQLEKFYQEVSTPSLQNVTFNYIEDVNSLTINERSLYFYGSEFIISGRIPSNNFYSNPIVRCIGYVGPIVLTTTVTTSVGELERLWAYLTVQKTLEAKKKDETKSTELNKKALDLALKYKFVTEVTSLVVVKPNSSTSAVDTIRADGTAPNFASGAGIPPGASGGAGPIGSLSSSKFAGPGPPSGPAPHITPPPTPPASLAQIPTAFKQFLGWLESYLRPDGTLDFLKGFFTLGFNATFTKNQTCSNMYSLVGNCKLIKDCVKLHPSLRDKSSFTNNLCTIENKYAGVCCV